MYGPREEQEQRRGERDECLIVDKKISNANCSWPSGQRWVTATQHNAKRGTGNAYTTIV